MTGWEGPRGNLVTLDRTELHRTVRSSLSRTQLRDLILLERNNPEIRTDTLVCLVLLHEDSYIDPRFLAKHGLRPLARVSLAEEANFACSDRETLENQVLSFISS